MYIHHVIVKAPFGRDAALEYAWDSAEKRTATRHLPGALEGVELITPGWR